MRLQQARDAAGMTQQHVEERLGLTTRSVSRWEHAHASPDFASIHRLADLFSVSLDWLAGRTPLRPVFRPDHVVVNTRVKPLLEEMVQDGKSLEHIPPELLRNPGIDYLYVIPPDVIVLHRDAALRLDLQVQKLVRQLGDRR